MKILVLYDYKIKDRRVDFTNLHKWNDGILLKFMRNISICVGSTLGEWKNKLNEYDIVVVIDSITNYKVCEYISRHSKKTKLVFYYRNSVESKLKQYSPDKLKNLGYILGSYNKHDCEKYDICYLSEFMCVDTNVFEKHFEPSVKYDAVFVGAAKDRKDMIKGIKDKFDRLGYNVYFYVTGYPELSGNRCKDNEFLSYDKYIDLMYESKAIIDLVGKSNYGLTIRPIEAMLSKRKLITNYTDVLKYDFYNENNILVYFDNDEEFELKVMNLLNTRFCEVDSNIVDSYTLNGWIDKIIEL